jgi:hypothetical protein
MSQPIQQLSDAHKAYDVPSPITNETDPSLRIPERQVYSNEEKYEWKIGNRNVKITGGFNEPNGHSSKGSMLYLDSKNPDPNKPATKSPGNYNVGIDFVYSPNGSKNITPLYSGEVVSAKNVGSGYGNQVIIKTNQSYEYGGKRYPIYNAYSHMKYIEKNILDGRIKNVDTDTYLGEMGKSGLSSKHGEHVDLQCYIMVNGKKIQISPNLMQDNLEKQSQQGTFRYSQNSDEANNQVVFTKDINTFEIPHSANVQSVNSSNAQQTSIGSTNSNQPTVNVTNSQTADLQQIELKSLYTQLYNLAVESSGGDQVKLIKHLNEYGENGIIAYTQNDSKVKDLPAEEQRKEVDNAFKNATAKQNSLG